MTFNPFTLRKQLKAHQESVASLAKTTRDQAEKISELTAQNHRLQSENGYLKEKVKSLSAANIALHEANKEFATKDLLFTLSQPRKERRQRGKQCKKS